MVSAKKIARRTFLIGSAAIAGGIAVGYVAYKRPHDNPLADGLADGEAALTPFVKITRTGITLIAPRADVGQGIASAQALMIADELDLDPDQFTVDTGQPAPVYYNGTVVKEGVPFPAYDKSWLAESMRGFMDVPAKLLGLQITGGSSSIPDMYERLRTAGAVARETLKKAASLKATIPVDQLRTQSGAVLLPDGSRIPYTDLAEAASGLEPVTNITLRSPQDWRYIGQPVQRLDITAKSTGTFTYGIDIAADDMLYATVKANPGIGAGVKRWNGDTARSMRGVVDIMPVTNGIAIIADNSWRAFQAADALEIEWETPDYPATSAEMWDKLEDVLASGDYTDSQFRDDGNVGEALLSGDRVEAKYRLPYLAHAPLEPMTVGVKRGADQIDIWTGTQIPGFVKTHAADLTGLDESKVKVHVLPSGGSFGARLEDTHVLQAIEIAEAHPDTLIKLTWSREEDMSHDYPRPMTLGRAEGTVADGQIEAVALDCVAQSVSRSWFSRLMEAPPGPDITIVAGAHDQPFAIPHYRVTGHAAPEMVPVSSWRSVGASANGFIHESFMDELIHKAGADPLQERLRLCVDESSRRVLEAVGEMASWSGTRPQPGVGRGLAFVMSFGVPVAVVLDVRDVDGAIKLEEAFVACDVGRVIDPVNFEAQVTGGLIFGLAHAVNCALTYEDHRPVETNFHAYEGLKLYQTPTIHVKGLENGPLRGIGEPAVPPAAPALGNAIFAATGKRIRDLPFAGSIDFL